MRSRSVFPLFGAVIAAIVSACTADRIVAPPQPVVRPIQASVNSAPPDVRAVPEGTVLPVEGLRQAPQARGDFGIASTVVPTSTGTPSLVWFATDGSATIWKMQGPVWAGEGATILTIPSPWKLVASGDMNGDGHPDLIWEATTDGTRAVTFMNGSAYAGSYAMMFQFSPDWKIVGLADFNFDGKLDMVITNSVTNSHAVLFLNGTAWTGSTLFLPNYGPDWHPVAVADMNGDTKPDLVYQSQTFSGGTLSWSLTSLLNGANVLGDGSAFGYSRPLPWRIGAAGDFDLDGKPDFVWQNTSTGERMIAFMNNTVATGDLAVLPTVSIANMVVSAPKLQYSVAPINLKLQNFYVTQAVQDVTNSVPLIRFRSALVRVFVTANDYNSLNPVVRVTVSHFNAGSTNYFATKSGGPGVPTFLSQISLGTSYNVTIPASELQTNDVTITVTVDPANAIAETDETDNAGLLPLVISNGLDFNVRFIPIHITSGEVGNVTVANVPLYMNMAMKIWPFWSYLSDVHAQFNSSAANITADASWNTMLSEMSALRVAEGSPLSYDGRPRYYYGVLPNLPNAKWGGLGYYGYPAAIGLGVTSSTDTSNAAISAHEWGHNLNRLHSPGCGPSSPDPSYPVPSGHTDSYGYDVSTASANSPNVYYDIMSYCFPKWVSGWNFKQVLNFVPSPVVAGDVPPVPSLVVWGRINPDGSAVLEPAFEVTTRPVRPAGRGKFKLQGRDQTGGVLFSEAFDGYEIPDGTAGVRHFAYAIPISTFESKKLESLNLVRSDGVSMGVGAIQTASIQMAAAPEAGEALGRSGDGIDLRWNASLYRMVVVRDAATGDVIGFARGGAAHLATKGGGQLDLIFSDGVRSRSKRVARPF